MHQQTQENLFKFLIIHQKLYQKKLRESSIIRVLVETLVVTKRNLSMKTIDTSWFVVFANN